MRVKILAESGDQIKIMPTYGLAMELAAKKGWYKVGRVFAILFAIAAAVLIVLHAKDVLTFGNGAGFNALMFVIIGIAMALFFLKPSQVMVNNEIWVKKADFDTAVKNGTEEQLFTRLWA